MLIKYLLVWAIISNFTLINATDEVAFFSNWVGKNYPKCQLKKKVLFIDPKLRDQLKLDSSIVLRFKGVCENQPASVYIQSRIVRTLNQTLAIKVQNKQISDIKIINFMEPKSYMAPKKWMELLYQKKLNNLKKVDALSGATLTRKSTIKVSEDSLKIHLNHNEKI